ncbi:hypothetical protein [Lacinutrix undariae]
MKKPSLSMLLFIILILTLMTSCGENKQEENTNTELNLENMDLSFDFDIDFSETYKREKNNKQELYKELTEAIYHGDFSKRDEDSKNTLPYYGFDIVLTTEDFTVTPFETENSISDAIEKWEFNTSCDTKDCVTDALQILTKKLSAEITNSICASIKVEHNGTHTKLYSLTKSCE